MRHMANGSDNAALVFQYVKSKFNLLFIFQSSDMLQCMASCHSVTIIEEKLSGDPMDVIMFVSTGWNLEEQSAESTNQVESWCLDVLSIDLVY